MADTIDPSKQPLVYGNTPLIKVEAASDMFTPAYEVPLHTYPKYFSDVFGTDREFSNVMPPQQVSAKNLLDFGYAPVYETDRPSEEQQVVTEGQPVLGDDGLWYRTWETRPFNDEEIASRLQIAKDNANNNLTRAQVDTFAQGIKHDFTDGESTTTLHIAVDNGERGNVVALGFQAKYRMEKSIDDKLSIRTIEGNVFDLEPSAMYDLVYDVTTKYQAVLDHVWTLRNEITAAADIASMPTIPEILE